MLQSLRELIAREKGRTVAPREISYVLLAPEDREAHLVHVNYAINSEPCMGPAGLEFIPKWPRVVSGQF